jgi:hypothetical protein
MSFDLQIDQVCPHLITEEALMVSSDRLTVRPLRPISSAASVKVSLNNEIPVPSSGVFLPAKSSGTRRGPFSVTAGTNDTLQLVVNQGAAQTVVMSASRGIPASRVAAQLNQQLTGVVFSVVNDRLAFETRDTGRASSVFLTSASTAASLFGFTANREYRGQQSVPGWTLVSDPTTLDTRPARFIVFDEPLQSASDFVEISYGTLQQECRRCGGIGLENDWRYDSHGKVIEIRDESLLIQELQKDFYAIRGSNPFHTWYGTGLIEAIGKKLTAGGFAQNLIVSDIYQAFSRWQSIKRQQEDNGQFVSDKEYPFRLLSVNLQQSSQDPTVIFVTVTVQNRSNDPIQLTRGLKLPQSLAMVSSTNTVNAALRPSLSSSVLTG